MSDATIQYSASRLYKASGSSSAFRDLPSADAAPDQPATVAATASFPVAGNVCRLGLSDREVEVMQWLKIGKTNHEIGCILEISACTVKNHLQRIFRKLVVFNRTHAVAKFVISEQELRS